MIKGRSTWVAQGCPMSSHDSLNEEPLSQLSQNKTRCQDKGPRQVARMARPLFLRLEEGPQARERRWHQKQEKAIGSAVTRVSEKRAALLTLGPQPSEPCQIPRAPR